MGIYDRAYYRDDEGSSWMSGRPMIVNLVILNFAVYAAQILIGESFTSALALRDDLFTHPWHVYQLVTYGFLHDPHNIMHILFNMLSLWFFGSDLEGIYGRKEILRFYLAAIVVAGIAWVGIQAASGVPGTLVGASGGVMGLVILFVMHFPRRLIYIWGILPLPAWALGTLFVVLDMTGAASGSDSNVANVAHLGGMAFGFIYYQSGMNLGRLIPRRLSDLGGGAFRLRPKLRIHDPQDEVRDLSAQVDEILAKISREGEASLTKTERRTLEEASRRYQRRRQ